MYWHLGPHETMSTGICNSEARLEPCGSSDPYAPYHTPSGEGEVPVPGMRGMETMLMWHYHLYPMLPLSNDLICMRTSLRTSPFRINIMMLKVTITPSDNEKGLRHISSPW